ncbi:tape measure protein [Pseudomonas kurunegalensis]|uniref:tape measure protein n=1 Tax=Pseudomonas kurunegalensis TaxID=485880 RepID=UPI0021186733|nr:tape measure protein [Pseudomonas kurunegalensis]
MAQESRLSIVIDSRNARQQIDQLRTSLNSLGDAGGEATVNVRGLGTAARAAGSALAALGVGAVAREVLRMTDAFKNMQGSLALVSISTANASESFQKLLAMANNTGSSLESTVSLYTRLANATRGAGYTQEQMLNVTDALNKAFVISGATMQEASNAAIQLSQGLASGTLRGEELNSVMEQGPRITRALADYLGVTNGEIRKLAAEGKITGDVVTNALLKSLTSLNAELAKMPRTFEQASQALKNNFLAAIGQINVDPVVSSVDALASSLAKPEVVMGIQNIANALGSLVAVGGDGLKTVAENTDALMAITGAYVTKVGVGLVASLGASAKARLTDLSATLQQASAARASAIADAQAAQANVRRALAEKQLTGAKLARANVELLAARGTNAETFALEAQIAAASANRQATIALTEAKLSQTAAEAALTATATRGAAARSAAMAAFGGPLGIITLGLSAVAGAWIYFTSSTDSATEALNDQNRTLEDSIANYRALGAEQQRLKSQEWLKIQASALDEASSALEKYRAVVVGGGLGSDELRSKFQDMFAEVKSGQRTLDSLTGWIVSNTSLSKSYQSSLVELAASHFSNTEKAERYAQLLGRTKTATDGAASSSASLASAQKASAAATAGGSQAWEKYIAQLTQTRDLVGANAAQEAAYTAEKAKFKPKQIEYARLIGEQTELLKAYEQAVRDGKKAEQDRLSGQLLVSIKSSEALRIQMEAQGKAMNKMAENAEESSKRQITAMQQAANFAVASAARMVSPLSAPQQNLQGASLLTFGQPQTYAKSGSASVKTPEQQLREMLDRLDGNTETKPTKTKDGLSSKLNEAKTAFDNLYKAAQPAKFALQEYVERQSQLELLLSKGKITQQQYNEALAQSSSMYAEVVQGQDEHLARLKQINDQYVKGQSLAELYAQKAAATGIQGPAGQIAQAGIDASIKGQVFNGKPNTSQIDAVIGGAGSELMRMTQENEQLQAWYDQRIAMYQQYRKLEVENAAQYDETIRQLEKQRAEDTLNNERSMSVARLSLAEGMFGDLTSIVGAFAGQQSGAYKAMFAVQKAASIAQSIISIQTGIAMAAANPFPLNLAAMASVAAATASIVGNIQSVGLNLATGGYVRGPGTGTSDSIPANLSNGEFVVNAAATKRNRALLEAINSNERVSVAGGAGAVVSTQSGSSGASGIQQNIYIQNHSTAQVEQRRMPNGDLEFVIREATDRAVQEVAGQFATGYGDVVDSYESAYGRRRTGG